MFQRAKNEELNKIIILFLINNLVLPGGQSGIPINDKQTVYMRKSTVIQLICAPSGVFTLRFLLSVPKVSTRWQSFTSFPKTRGRANAKPPCTDIFLQSAAVSHNSLKQRRLFQKLIKLKI